MAPKRQANGGFLFPLSYLFRSLIENKWKEEGKDQWKESSGDDSSLIFPSIPFLFPFDRRSKEKQKGIGSKE